MPALIDGIFWGVLLIAVGAWFILRRFVPVHIPVIRLVIAVLFIYVGIRVLVRGPFENHSAIFSETHQKYAAGSGPGLQHHFRPGGHRPHRSHGERDSHQDPGERRVRHRRPPRQSFSSAAHRHVVRVRYSGGARRPLGVVRGFGLHVPRLSRRRPGPDGTRDLCFRKARNRKIARRRTHRRARARPAGRCPTDAFLGRFSLGRLS